MSDVKRDNTAPRIIVPSRSRSQAPIPDRSVSDLQRAARNATQPTIRSAATSSGRADQPFILPMPPTLPSITTLLSLSATIRQADALGIQVEQ